MELEYSDRNSRRSKVYIAVGIIIALIVGAVVFVVLQASGLTAKTEVETRQVVVAVREIPARKPIEEGDIATRTVAADPTNANAFKRLDEALGRVTGVAISTGQLLSPNLLASTTEGQAFSILPPGEKFDPNGPDLRAVSVNVPDDRAVGGTLQAGQRVDLVVTMGINPELGQQPTASPSAQPAQFVPGPSTKVTLQKLDILSRNGALYILRTDLATSEKVSELAAAGGQFTMVLRPDADDRTAKTDGSTLDRLIDEFGFPVPLPPDFNENQATR